jgi:hypothetical protein
VVKGSGGHPALKIAALNSNLLSAIYATPPMTGKKKRDAVIRVYDETGNVIGYIKKPH